MMACRPFALAKAMLAACLLLAARPDVAHAGKGISEMRSQLEASTLVTGTVDIGLDGSVTAHSIDHAELLPQAVVRLIGKAAPGWKFEPVVVDGKTVEARTRMTLRIAGGKNAAGQTVVWIRSGRFGESIPGEGLEDAKLDPPQYPRGAGGAGVNGVVYLLVKIGRDGKVVDAFAEQVNLRVVTREPEMPKWRDSLSEAALKAAKRWTFTPPTKGPDVDAPFWVARVPVDFLLPGQHSPRYGEWEAYIPGPVQRAPWLQKPDAPAFSPDALPPGGVYAANVGPKLLTPLGG